MGGVTKGGGGYKKGLFTEEESVAFDTDSEVERVGI